jgi:hypothetical protein
LFVLFFGLAMVSLSLMAYATLSPYQFNVLGATPFHLAINLTAALVAAVVVLLRRDQFLAHSKKA